MVQLQILNFIIQNKSWSIVEDNCLSAEYFCDYTEEFKFLKDEQEAFNSVPSYETFLSKFPDFEKITVTDPPEMLLSDLRFDKLVREVAANYNSMKNHAMSGNKTELTDAIYAAIEKFSNLLVEGQSIKEYSGDMLTDMVLSTYQQNFYTTVYSTGLMQMNEYLGGWEKDSDYVVVAARPGHGKSMLMCKFAAEQLKQGRRVGYYSGEMPARQITERILSAMYGLESSKIFHRDKEIEEQLNDAISSFKERKKLFIVEPSSFGNKYPTAIQLEAFCRQCHIDVLFIDQQSLMRDIEKTKMPYEKASNVSRQIKAMRDKLNIPVITAVQLNRTKVDKDKSDTVQLAGSDVIGQDATKVLIIQKTDVDDSTIAECVIHIAKNRTGKTGNFSVLVDMNTCTWVDNLQDLADEISFDAHEVIEQQIEASNHMLYEKAHSPFSGENIF